MRSALPLAVIVASLAVAGPARADIPPSPDHSEACTVERQQADGARCEACDATSDEPRACQTSMTTRTGEDGARYRFRCKTWGVISWKEVWCAAPGAPPPSPSAGDAAGAEDPPGSSGCAAAPSRSGVLASTAAFVALVVTAALSFRRGRGA